MSKHKKFISVTPVLVLLTILVSTPIRRSYAPGTGDQDGIVAFFDPAKIEWVQTNGPPGGRISQLMQSSYHHNKLYTITGNRLYR